MDYLLDIFFRTQWEDRRLAHSELEGSVLLAANEKHNIIWTPDLYFPNEKKASFHHITRPNRRLEIFSNGTVTYSTRLTLTLNCPMILTYYPMDKQECFIKIASYSYPVTDLQLKWSDWKPIETPGNELTLPQFEVQEYTSDVCQEIYTTGEYACLKATFRMKRRFGFFMLRTYIPSMLLVILSWISFWIHKGAVPARITLGVTTVLAMTTQLGSSHSGNLRISYPKAIDVWYTFCMILVFGALIEYAFVTLLARREQEEEEKKKGEKKEDIEAQAECSTRNARRKGILNYHGGNLTADTIDSVSKVMFPAAFGLFNFLYWIIYLQPTVPKIDMSMPESMG